MSVALERDHTYAMFDRIEQIEDVADTLTVTDPRRRKLESVVADELSGAAFVRPVIAADLLGLTEKTVRTWVREGVLLAQQERSRLLLDPVRLHEVRYLVRKLRAAGQNHRLLDEVYRQLADAAVLDRDDLQESMAQMRRGQGRVVRGAA